MGDLHAFAIPYIINCSLTPTTDVYICICRVVVVIVCLSSHLAVFGPYGASVPVNARYPVVHIPARVCGRARQTDRQTDGTRGRAGLIRNSPSLTYTWGKTTGHTMSIEGKHWEVQQSFVARLTVYFVYHILCYVHHFGTSWTDIQSPSTVLPPHKKDRGRVPTNIKRHTLVFVKAHHRRDGWFSNDALLLSAPTLFSSCWRDAVKLCKTRPGGSRDIYTPSYTVDSLWTNYCIDQASRKRLEPLSHYTSVTFTCFST